DANQGAGANEQQSAVPQVAAETVTVGAGKVIAVATGIVGGVANAFFVIVLAFYLLIEGERTWRYFARYMRPHLRYRFHRLGPALTNVVSGYLSGEVITSTLFRCLFLFVIII